MKSSYAILIIIALAGLIIWGFSTERQNLSIDGQTLDSSSATPVGEDNAGVIQDIPRTNPSTSFDSAQDKSLRVNKYTHENPHFSFEYPSGFSVSSFKDANVETILVQGRNPSTGSTGSPQASSGQVGGRGSFQIYITPQDEYFAVTKERILADAPGTVVEGEREIMIGPSTSSGSNDVQTKGLSFASKSTSFGATREIWFTNPVRGDASNGTNGLYLYQITGYPEAETVMRGVLGTWMF